MNKIDNVKTGDVIYSLDRDEIVEWAIIGENPQNDRFFIIINKLTNVVREVHWKTLEYGDDKVNYFSLSKIELIERYKKRSAHIIRELSKHKIN